MPGRWLAYALAGLATGLLTLALYYGASWLAPRLFHKTFPVDTGRGVVELQRGMSMDDVVAALGKPGKEEPMALRGFRQWTYSFEGAGAYGLVFEKGRLDAVTPPGRRRPGFRGRAGRGRW